MMLYADRAFISINGFRLVDLQTATLRQGFNSKPVESMTPDGYNRGAVRGNRSIDIDFTLAVENLLASPKLENVDYEANDVAVNFLVGADQYVCTPIFPKEVGVSAPNVGEEVKKSFSFFALKMVDAVGNSALFDIQLT